jgi:hypothetical protein
MSKINEMKVIDKLEGIVEKFLDDEGWRRGFLRRLGYGGKMSAAEIAWAGKHLSLEVCWVARSGENVVTMKDGRFLRDKKEAV